MSDHRDEVRNKPCLLCRKPSDPCHIKSRGSGGSDERHNLINLCREHHTLQHSKGWLYMVNKFPIIGFELAERGWYVDKEIGKLFRLT